MPESVDHDGAVRGPAPQGSTNVATICAEHNAGTPTSAADGDRNPETAVSHKPSTGDTVVSLELDAQHALRTELIEANRDLAEAYSSQEQHEKRLERVCSNLLISGERIPALDQSSLSMMQEAYLNASTAAVVASEKIIIMQALVTRLDLQLRELIIGAARQTAGDLRQAA